MTITRFDKLYQFEMSVLCTTPNIIYDSQFAMSVLRKNFACKQRKLILTENYVLLFSKTRFDPRKH